MDSSPLVDYSPAMMSHFAITRRRGRARDDRRQVHVLIAVGMLAGAVGLTACGSGTPETAGGAATSGTSTSRSTSAPPSPSVATSAELAARLDQLTAYDSTAPLGDRHEADPPTPRPDGVAAYDISWVSPGGGRVSAWLVRPPTSVPGPYAGLVYVHGSETDRNDLLDEAAAMASAGVLSLVIDAPFARPAPWTQPYLESYDDPAPEVAMNAQAVIDVRRAYDLLASRPDVDPARMGYVGHSWGASLGVAVAAVDDRPAAFALLSPRPSWTGFLRTSHERWVLAHHQIVGDEAWERYLQALAPFDALSEVGRVDGSRLLVQYGRADTTVPAAVAQQLVDAAPGGTTTQWFDDAGHALDAAAVKARCDWLSGKLGAAAVSAEELAAVGLPDQ